MNHRIIGRSTWVWALVGIGAIVLIGLLNDSTGNASLRSDPQQPATLEPTQSAYPPAFAMSNVLLAETVPVPTPSHAAAIPQARAAVATAGSLVATLIVPIGTPTPEPTATATMVPPSPTPFPTRAGPPRVGLQVGHWEIGSAPEEMANLRTAHGTYNDGIDEWEVNYEVAIRAMDILEAEGVIVDLLTAIVPVGYEADVFLSLHADGIEPPRNLSRHGWKIATPFLASPASVHFRDVLAEEYAAMVPLPEDADHINVGMTFYYSFNHYRYQHAIAPTTPAAIIEMGYMTHPDDKVLLLDQPDLLAQAIANGVLRYLRERDPTDRAAVQRQQPAPLRPHTTADLLELPRENAFVILPLTTEDRLIPTYHMPGWYFVLVRDAWKIGWVRADAVESDTVVDD